MPPLDRFDPMAALPFCLTKGENLVFFLCRNALPPYMGKSYCPYTEKPPQAVFFPF